MQPAGRQVLEWCDTEHLSASATPSFLHCRYIAKFPGYAYLAVHYGWALGQIFDDPRGYEGVVILEEDIEVAPDFYPYFAATALRIGLTEQPYSCRLVPRAVPDGATTRQAEVCRAADRRDASDQPPASCLVERVRSEQRERAPRGGAEQDEARGIDTPRVRL